MIRAHGRTGGEEASALGRGVLSGRVRGAVRRGRLGGGAGLGTLAHLAQQLLLLVGRRLAVGVAGGARALLIGAGQLLALSAHTEKVVTALGHGVLRFVVR